jgi:hypothetical protein
MNPPVKNTLEGLSRGEMPMEGLIRETVGAPSGLPVRRIEGIVTDTMVGLRGEPVVGNVVMKKVRHSATKHKDGMVPFMGKYF